LDLPPCEALDAKRQTKADRKNASKSKLVQAAKEIKKAVSNQSELKVGQLSAQKISADTNLDQAGEDKKPGSVLKQRSLTSFFKK